MPLLACATEREAGQFLQNHLTSKTSSHPSHLMVACVGGTTVGCFELIVSGKCKDAYFVVTVTNCFQYHIREIYILNYYIIHFKVLNVILDLPFRL